MGKQGGRPKRKRIDRLRAKAWARELERDAGKSLSAIAAAHTLDRSNLYKIRRGALSPTSYLWLSPRARQVYEIGPHGVPLWSMLADPNFDHVDLTDSLPDLLRDVRPSTPVPSAFVQADSDQHQADMDMEAIEQVIRLAGQTAEETEHLMEVLDLARLSQFDHFLAAQPWAEFCRLVIDYRSLILSMSSMSTVMLDGLIRSVHERVSAITGRPSPMPKNPAGVLVGLPAFAFDFLSDDDLRAELISAFRIEAEVTLERADCERFGLTPAELIDAALDSMR